MENFFNIIFEDSVGFSFILHFNSQLKVKIKDTSKNIRKENYKCKVLVYAMSAICFFKTTGPSSHQSNFFSQRQLQSLYEKGTPLINLYKGYLPWRRARQPTPVFLLGESPWTEAPGGLQPIRSQRAGQGDLSTSTRMFNQK